MSADSPQETYFSILGLPLDANDAQINEAYRRAVAASRDDPERRRRIEQAHSVLVNPGTRRRYREMLRQSGVQADAATPRPSPAPAAPPSVPGKPSGPGKRQRTEYLDAECEPARDDAPRVPTARPPKAGRAQTELLDGAVPAGPAPAPAPARPSKGRAKTELVGDTLEVPPERGTSGRQGTVVVEVGSDPSSPAGRAPTIMETPQDERPGGMEAGKGDPQSSAGRPPTIVDAQSDKAGGRTPTDVEPGTPVALAPSLLFTYRGESRTVPLQRGDNLVGRPPSKGNPPDVPIEDPERYVSRQHALIRVLESECSIEDLASDNGTCLNGERLEPGRAYVLEDGDVIEIQGRELRLQMPER